MRRLPSTKIVPLRSEISSPGSPTMRLMNVEPPSPSSHRSAVRGALKTTICPRFGSPNLYASRLAITRSLNRPWQIGNWPRAMERWLHRRRGNAVRLGDLRFERQDEGNRDCDRDEPVDDRPPRLRYPALRTIENSHASIRIVRTVSAGVRSRNHDAAARRCRWVASRSQGGLTVALMRGSSLLSNPSPPLTATAVGSDA